MPEKVNIDMVWNIKYGELHYTVLICKRDEHICRNNTMKIFLGPNDLLHYKVFAETWLSMQKEGKDGDILSWIIIRLVILYKSPRSF